MMSDDATDWARGLDELGQWLAPRFSRVEPRRRALAYLKGLLAPIARKNGWHLAEAAGDATPDGVQDFLARARWEADVVRDELRAYVVERLSDPQAVLMLDETGFVKKSTHSVGVQRQHSGTAGRIEDGQIGVCLGYASPKGHALIDRALYRPESWTKGRARCAAAGVPDGVALATKPKLGRQMLARAFAAGVPCAWVVGESVYGADYALRRFVQTHGRGYVRAVTGAQRLGFKTVEDWLEDVPAASWVRLSAGDGAKGPRLCDWAYRPDRSDTAQGWQKGLLIRRKIAKPDELTFSLTLAPAPTPLADPVRVAGTRWTIEARFEAAKGEVGLDEYEARSWTGWHRHITLAMLAHAALTVVRQAAAGGKPGVDLRLELPPHTGPEVRRPLWHLIWARPPDPVAALALAPTPSAARAPLPLAPTNVSP